MLYIDENLHNIKEKIETIKKDNCIDYDVLLVAVTKNVSVDKINYAIDNLFITDIGENRVQELLEKYETLHKDNLNIHFIGALQTNKVKYIIDKVCIIHSLDSVKLAAEINKQAQKINIVMNVLIEINIGREQNKNGILPENLYSFYEEISEFKNIRIKGLMTIAPKLNNKEDYCKYFIETRDLFVDISQKKLHNILNPILSMGMSNSYEVAIETGANLVRVGSAIFGNRI